MEIPLSVFFRYFLATAPQLLSGISSVRTFYEQLNAAMDIRGPTGLQSAQLNGVTG